MLLLDKGEQVHALKPLVFALQSLHGAPSCTWFCQHGTISYAVERGVERSTDKITHFGEITHFENC